jgi:putative nucleotidyltransferase with HDIG domain
MLRLWNRVNRLFRAMRPDFAKPDDAFALEHLPQVEYNIYANMDARDREHAVRVAQYLLTQKPDASPILIRAALLHDCGKQVRPYRWRERVWAGLQAIPQVDFDAAMRKKRLLSALEVRALHPQLGAMLIRSTGGDPRVAQIVERHHQPFDDADAAWIHAVDEWE